MGQPFQNSPHTPDLHINTNFPTPEAQAALRQIAEHLAAHPADPCGEFAQHLALLTRLAPLTLVANSQPNTLPLIGSLITRVKRSLHQLIVFYLNDLAAQQGAFNHQLVQTLHALDSAQQRPPERPQPPTD